MALLTRQQATSDKYADAELEGEEEGFACDQCPKRAKRMCDMKLVGPEGPGECLTFGRKHRLRHSRPYGCTFASCNKKFGSKVSKPTTHTSITNGSQNDWKRHEASQHYQEELWKCLEPALPGSDPNPFNECGEVFWRENIMSHHLTSAHGLNRHKASAQLTAYHVGPNHQQGFWCGFCRNVVPLKCPFGVEAYDERFNHIDVHLVRERRPIEGWVDVRTHKTKVELRMRREQEERDAKEEAAAAGALVLASAAAAAQEQAGARKRARTARTARPAGGARVEAVAPSALAGYREVEERRGRGNQEEFGHTVWVCVSGPLFLTPWDGMY
jgi:hypothetical protein